jgi:shikimate dehydrogenase
MEAYHLGLVGYPLGHSRSPAIHRAALHAAGLVGEYRLYPIPPMPQGAAGLEALLSRMRIGDITGLNVTIPHKQLVVPLLDGLTPTAQAIGAVNTILLKDGRLLGDNTDAQGFLADLRRLAAEVFTEGRADTHASRPVSAAPAALVLGAGGSARAVVFALWHAGFRVIIAARRPEAGEQIIHQFENSSTGALTTPLTRLLSAIPFDLASLTRLIAPDESRITFVVNTTPLGMHPDTNASPWPVGLPFPQGSVVYDLVYNPVETLLVQQARQAGLRAFTSLGMLVEQAALAFELWTGQPAPREVMHLAAEQV